MPAHLTAHIGQLIRRILLYVVRQLGCFRIQADIFRIRLSEAAAGTRDVLIVHDALTIRVIQHPFQLLQILRLAVGIKLQLQKAESPGGQLRL